MTEEIGFDDVGKWVGGDNDCFVCIMCTSDLWQDLEGS